MDKRVSRLVVPVSIGLAISCCLTLFPANLSDCNFEGLAANAQSNKSSARKGPAKGGQQAGKGAPNNSVTPGRHLDTPEIRAYLARLHNKFDNNWLLVDGKFVVTITATVAPDGTTSDIQINGVPSNPEAEQAANEAFAKAQPFDALPGSAGGTVKLTVQFDSYSDPHGDSNRNIKSQMDPITATAP